MGKIFAIFNLSGNIPDFKDWLIIKDNGFNTTGSRNLMRLLDIPSYPVLVFDLI
jgi:hypothetical protein